MTEPADTPPHRYTAALAGRIETAWQDRWEREGTFHAPNPTGPLCDGFDQVAGRPRRYVLDMFPYPSGEGLHVGHPLGYIGTDVYAPVPADVRLQRAAHDGLRRIRAAGRAVRGGDRAAPALDHRGQHPDLPPAAAPAGPWPRPRRSVATTDVEFYRWTQWIFLQIFGAWYDPDASQGPAGRRAGGRAGRPGSGEPAEGTNPSGRPWAELSDSRAPAGGGRTPAGVPVRRGRQLVPRPGHRAGERGGHPRRAQRARQLPGLPAAADSVDAAHHRVRGPADRRPGHRRLAGVGGPDAAQLDRPVHRRAGPLRLARRRHRGLHHPAGHAVRRHVLRAGPGAPAGGRRSRPSRWPDGTPSGVDRRRRAPRARPSPSTARPRPRRSELERQTEGRDKTGVFTGSYALNPVNGEPVPIFVADYVLMGYGTGAIMAVPAHDQRDLEFAQTFRLPVVKVVRAAGRVVRAAPDRPGHPAGRVAGGVHRRRRPGRLCERRRLAGRTGQGGGEGPDHGLAAGAGPGRGRDHVQAAGLAVQPAAVLGRAVPDRVRRARACRSRCRSRCCRSSCRR